MPAGAEWQRAVEHWRQLASDVDARYDQQVRIEAADIGPTITYGTHPGMVTPLAASIPTARDAQEAKALAYMRFTGGAPITGEKVDVVFVGSCTNSRLSDLREAAGVLRGRKVASGVRMLVVPGSVRIKQEAEAEGLDAIFLAAGAEWRDAGCSMCIGMNGDIAQPGQLVVSTSNRNFEGRQGPGARTVLASPLVAAVAAVSGCITDPATFLEHAA